MKKRFIIILVLFHLLLAAAIPLLMRYWPFIQQYVPQMTPTAALPAPPDNLAAMARRQIGVTLKYDPTYESIAYPGGDIPIERGVCTDVVIRAMRLKGIDLQQEVHEDMAHHFSVYPKNWGLKRPDKNIDHRRVPNLQTFFKRKGWSLPVTQNPDDYHPGDLVTCIVGSSLPHIMIVSDRKSAEGIPLIIHNIGGGTEEEDCLFTFPLNGHYRPKLK